MERIKNYLINFMRGRYGIDQMSQTLFIAALIFILFAGFTQNFLFEMIGIALFALRKGNNRKCKNASGHFCACDYF